MNSNVIPLAGLALILAGCQPQGSASLEANTLTDFTGIYVSDGYERRAEGYDWVGVSINSLSDTTAHVAVRSRIDQKKATCTFDSDARLTDNGTLVITMEDKLFTLSLSGDSLSILGRDGKSENLLYYFCSGGATLQGNYIRLGEPVDTTQLSGEGFQKELSLQGITFRLQEVYHGFETWLIIEPSGLENDNRPVTHRIYGWVSGAETEDLNSDGSPELMVYIRSSGEGIRTRVIGYSVDSGKSMSQVSMPDILEDPEASKGYLGYDEYTIVETTLVQRFPLFHLTDSGYATTGLTRQVQYRLKEGEADRKFIVDRITEY